MILPPVYVLYCAELPDRFAGIRREIIASGLTAQFWRGYHGRTWGLRTVHEFAPGQHIPSGHVGLNLGAWALWQHIYLCEDRDARPDDAVIVLEDDAVLPPQFDLTVLEVLEDLEGNYPHWQLVFLGLAEREPHVWGKVTKRIGSKPDSRFCQLHEPFGTHAMMLRRSAFGVLLDNMTIAERNLDQQLWQRVLQPGLLNWCAILPSLIEQRTFDHRGTGKVEWAPSCIDEDSLQDAPPALEVREQDLKRMAGFKVAEKRPPADLIAATNLLIDPFPCIYRGEPLEELGINKFGRTVPLNQCARLNSACHSRPVDTQVTSEEGQPTVLACETCQYRLEMSGERTRPRLKLPDGHFNPSIAMWQGRLILATRDSWGHSKVALWALHNEQEDWTGEWAAEPIASLASDHPEAPRLEDPRLFVGRDPDTGKPSLCAMFNLPDAYPPKVVRVGYVQFTDDLSRITRTEIFRSPHGNLYEKNWSPFLYGNELHWVYASKPHHVILGERETFTTENPLPWTGGAMRGGAAPVFVPSYRFMVGDAEHAFRHGYFCGEGYPFGREDRYYHFFHGCLKRVQGSVYTVGCAVFEAKPPFKILRQTPTPLIWPDLPAADEDVVKRYVVWPGGVVPHAGAWHLVLGVDDTFCRIVRLPYEEVEAQLAAVPERDSGITTIRDTAITKGIPESERR